MLMVRVQERFLKCLTARVGTRPQYLLGGGGGGDSADHRMPPPPPPGPPANS